MSDEQPVLKTPRERQRFRNLGFLVSLNKALPGPPFHRVATKAPDPLLPKSTLKFRTVTP